MISEMKIFKKALTPAERGIMQQLDTPFKIQAFLDSMPYSAEPVYRCPLRVMQDRTAHCFDGALFAAAALRRLGYPPLILDMIPNDRDDDHLLALFNKRGHWGAVAKSNFTGLRFRESVYRTLRELVMSYFELYYNTAKEKTLRGYTVSLNLTSFDHRNWMISDEPLPAIADRLDRIRRFPIMSDEMIKELSLLDGRSYEAGMIGVNEAGLYKPSGS